MIGYILHFAQDLPFWPFLVFGLLLVLIDLGAARDWRRRVGASRMRAYARLSANKFIRSAPSVRCDKTARTWL